jgi:hypothetical protein
MSLTPGAKLGPYEILSPLGAGGMGEVYRARDSRLKRDVAVKVLPQALSLDADRLHRFEQEALATAALNHPNILAVFDIGTHDGAPYVVSELLEGETLRDRLRSGPVPVRKALDYALQIAHGLAAAHEKGIIHRDLKPENLFITKDGRVKILDFGLAKLTQSDPTENTSLPTRTHVTEAGTVMGTAGYMSPEQIRGTGLDARSDIFSFGSILYEMLSGRHAFRGDTPADTMSAILKEDPPDLSETNRNVSPALERIVHHCLEKNPEARFHSASDIAFDLEHLSGVSSTTARAQITATSQPRTKQLLAAALGLLLIALAFFAGHYTNRGRTAAVPDIHQLTFRRGRVFSARFAPDGQTVVYTAAWGDGPREIFTTTEQGPESRSLDIADAEVLAVSSKGEIAIKQHPRHAGASFSRPGTLATVPVNGGSPRALLDNVEAADFSPDGSQMAVIQVNDGQYSVQYPIGKTLFTAPNWISHLRISPSGDEVAFENHPFGGDEGSVMYIDKSGKAHELSSGWLTVQGLAWLPGHGNKEIWFTGTRNGANRALYAVATESKVVDGKNDSERVVTKIPGCLTIFDIGPQGQVLMIESDERAMAIALLPGDTHERDLSWLDYSITSGLSQDGKWLLSSEVGEGGGEHYSVYLRATDGSPAVRLGDGQAADLSSDGQYALSRVMGSPDNKLYLLPTQGAPRELSTGNVNPGLFMQFVPGTHRIVFLGTESGHDARVYLLDPDSNAPPKPLLAEGVIGPFAITDDAQFAICTNASGEWAFYPLAVAGGTPQPIHGMLPGERVFGMGSDDHTLFVGRLGELPQKVYELNAVTGERKPWKEISPPDRAGADSIGGLRVVLDGKAYIYWYFHSLSELYVFRGLL